MVELLKEKYMIIEPLSKEVNIETTRKLLNKIPNRNKYYAIQSISKIDFPDLFILYTRQCTLI